MFYRSAVIGAIQEANSLPGVIKIYLITTNLKPFALS